MSTFQKLLSTISHKCKSFSTSIAYFHLKLEDSIENSKDDDNIKIKKKMLLYYIYTTILYSICLPIFNPYASISQALLYILIALLQGVMIKVKNYYVLVSYFVIYTFLSIYLPSSKDDEHLKAVGVALMHHNLFFLFPDNVILKFFYIFFSLGVLKSSETRVFSIMEDGELDTIESMLKNFYLTWPLIYIVNHASSIYLVRAFQQAMRHNKSIENKLKEANIALQETNAKLQEAMTLLEHTNSELKDALKARELFIASVSHELRNPLNSMIGNIELLRLEISDDKLIKMLETCKICGEVLLGLISNVLDVAKINAEKLEINYLPGNFMKLMEKVWGISTLRMKQKGLQGELYVSNNFPKYLDMDPHRLMQILLNLLGNSTKFTKQGFIKVIVSWHENATFEELKIPDPGYLKNIHNFPEKDPQDGRAPDQCSEAFDPTSLTDTELEGDKFLTKEAALDCMSRSLYPKFFSHMLATNYSFLSIDDLKLKRSRTIENSYYQKQKGIIKIEIIDSGCGISPSSLQNLFQPFRQADATITRRFGGTGLGLYITQQLIQKMGGEIHVSSQEGIGSDFCILIPTTTATKKESQAQISEEENEEILKKKVSATGMRALILSDDVKSKDMLRDYMKKLKVQFDIAKDTEDALEKFTTKEQNYYSFAHIDFHQTSKEGFSACQQIRNFEQSLGRDIHIPIIITSGDCTEQERLDCLSSTGEIKATCLYRKPFTYADFKNSIETVIRKQKHLNLRKSKILIADDDPFNVSVVKEYLEKNGFCCDVCYNGKEATEKALKTDYDAVLMDCEMPEMDGYTATSLIKQKCPGLLIIGVTGNTGEEDLQRGRQCGMNRMETKPLNFQKMVKMLKLL